MCAAVVLMEPTCITRTNVRFIIREVELPAQARRRRSTDTGVAVTTRVQYVMASDESEDDVMQAVNTHMACDNDPAR